MEIRAPRTPSSLGVVYERFERDGFTRLGKNWGKQHKLNTRKYQIECIGDDGWSRRSSRQRPLTSA